jgi:hypothetical protein
MERKSPNATLEQAAEFLQISCKGVRNLQDRGVINPLYIGGRRFYRWSDLEKLAKRGAPLPPKEQEPVTR